MSTANFMIVFENWPDYLQGLANALQVLSVSLVLGTALALALALARVHRIPVLDEAIRVYVYVFRGTPLLVQLYLVYFGLPQFAGLRDGALWTVLASPMYCAAITFTLNTAAYSTEIFRGAFEAVPPAELEAADACGMSRWTRTKRVLFPNALRRALPAYSNEVIFVLHATALLGEVAIEDVLAAARRVAGDHSMAYESYIVAAIVYGVIVYAITRAFKSVETRWGAGLQDSGKKSRG